MDTAKSLEDPEHHILDLLGRDDERVIAAACATGLGSDDHWRELVECHVENLQLLKQTPAPGGSTLYALAIACDFEGAWSVLEQQPDDVAAATLATHRQIWAILQTLRVRSRGFETRVFLLPRAIRPMFVSKLIKSGTLLLFTRLCVNAAERLTTLYFHNRANSKQREISGLLGPLIPFVRTSIRASDTYQGMTLADVPGIHGWLDELLPALLVWSHGYRAKIVAESMSAAKRSRPKTAYAGQFEGEVPAGEGTLAFTNGAQTGHQLLFDNLSEAGLLAVSLFRLMQLRRRAAKLPAGATPWWPTKLCAMKLPTHAELRLDRTAVVEMLTEYLAAKRKGKENGVFDEAIDEAVAFFAQLRSHPGGPPIARLSTDPKVVKLWQIFDSTDPLRCAADYGAR